MISFTNLANLNLECLTADAMLAPLAKDLQTQGVKLSPSAKGLDLLKDGKYVYRGVSLRPQTVLDFLDKKLGDRQMSVRTLLLHWLNGASMAAEKTPNEASTLKEAWQKAAASGGDIILKPPSEKIKIETINVTGAGSYPVSSDPLEASIVKLAQATALYQRVHGTGAGTIYFMIAATADGSLKLAARYLASGNKLTLRAEGSMIKHGARLQAAGIDVKKDYASVHLHAENNQMLARALGAFLYALDVEWATPLPRLSTIISLCAHGAK
jgi:hypothetical protein